MRLYSLIQALTENKRIDTIKEKFKDRVQEKLDNDSTARVEDANEFIDMLSSYDPTQKKIYVQWMMTHYLKDNVKYEDLYKFEEDLKKFEEVKRQLEKKDINQYTPTELFQTLSQIGGPKKSEKQKAKEIKHEGAEAIYKGKDAVVLKITDKDAACHYGKGTRWCTAATGSANYYKDYARHGPLYVILTHDGRKYQFWVPNDPDKASMGRYAFMDEEDMPVNPREIAEKYPTVGKIVNKLENILKDSPNAAMGYARNIIKGRWIEAEPTIFSSPYALHYLKQIPKDAKTGRFPEAEEHIVHNPEIALPYARIIIGGRWPEAEEYMGELPADKIAEYADIAQSELPPQLEKRLMVRDPDLAGEYAIKYKDERWPELERRLVKNFSKSMWRYILKHFNKENRDPQFEKLIVRSPFVIPYIQATDMGRWPEAERWLPKFPLSAAEYAHKIIKGPFPEAEREIMRNDDAREYYERNVKRSRR